MVKYSYRGIQGGYRMAKDDEEKKLLPEGQSRPLTAGEIELAKSVFGSSIDYSEVRVHHRSHNWFQPASRPMAPDGNLYYPAEVYKDDFSQQNVYDRASFIHEMTHVWQKQHNLFDPVPTAISLWWNNGLNYEKSYDTTNLSGFKDLKEYNMEQQGEIVKAYYYMRERQKDGPPEPFKPRDYDALERSPAHQLMLKKISDMHRKDPNDPMINFLSIGFGGAGFVFDRDGTAHVKRVPVEEQRHAYDEARRSMEISDRTITRIMANFADDPAYVSKCPIVRPEVEDSRVVVTGPKTSGMG